MHAEAQYLFRHILLREAAYQLQLPAARRRLHVQAIEVIEALCGGRPGPAGTLSAGGTSVSVPHATDAFAAELAEHAFRALGGDASAGEAAVLEARRMYLRRWAEHSEGQFRQPAVFSAWNQYASLAQGSERAEALRRACVATKLEGRPDLGREAIEESIRVFREAGDLKGEGLAMAELGLLEQALGRAGEAEGLFRQALAIHRRVGNARAERNLILSLANLHREMGRIEEAERLFEECLSVFGREGDESGEAVTRANLGLLYQETARFEPAEETMRAALAIHRRTANRRGEALVLQNLGLLFQETGRFQEAEALYARGLEICRAIGNLRLEGQGLGNLGVLYQRTSRLDLAARAYERALAISREVADRRSEGRTLGNLAMVRLEGLDPVSAEPLLRAALEIDREVVNRRVEGFHSCWYGRVLLVLGRHDEARSVWRRGAGLMAAHGAHGAIGEEANKMRALCANAGVEPFDSGEDGSSRET